jgi:hypothetical protein
MAMLKELVDNNLVESSYVSMVQARLNHFQIQMKCDCNKKKIEKHAKGHSLTIIEDKERKYITIFKS